MGKTAAGKWSRQLIVTLGVTAPTDTCTICCVRSSTQHGSHRQARHGTPRLPQYTLRRGPAQAVEKSVGTIGRHYDQIRANLGGCFQDGVSRLTALGHDVPSPISILWELYRGCFRCGSHVQQRYKSSRQLEIADQPRGGFHAWLRAGFAGDRDEDAPDRDRPVLSRYETLHTVGDEKRHLSRSTRDRLAHRLLQPAHTSLVLANRQHDQIDGTLFQKAKTTLHRIFARRYNFSDIDPELPHRAPGTALRQELPALERVAHCREVLPFGTGR